MKTGVNLVWDDGDGGDAYSSNDEIGVIPSNTSSDEVCTSEIIRVISYICQILAPKFRFWLF